MGPTNTPPAPAEGQLKRSLGRVETFFIGFGAMIGFGWITTTSTWLNDAGTLGAALGFVIGGAIMGLVGLVYAELVSAMPRAGGEHNYLLRGFGPRLAFIGSWGIVGGYVSVAAFEAVAIPRTIAYIVPEVYSVPLWTVADSDVYLVWALIGTATAAFLTVLNIRGIKSASLLQTSVVIFLIVMALAMIGLTFLEGDVSNAQPLFTRTSGLLAVLVVVPFFFVGFDVIPQSAEEINVPPRKIGRLVLVSVAMATLFYIVIILTTSTALPAAEMQDFDLATADAMDALAGEFGSNLVIAGGLAGLMTSWNAFLIGASRLMWAMARSGMLPTWFAKLHPTHRTPSNALIFIGIVCAIAPFFGEVMMGWLVASSSPSIVITYLLVSVVFLVLRRRDPGMDRPLRIGGRAPGGGTAIGVAAVIATACLLALYIPGMPAALDIQPYVIFGLWWLLGLAFLLRIPGGVRPGPDAEDDLLGKLAERGRGPRAHS
ncbi:APC family permease [Janibacter sp. DB-40]|uniref:APC family permease n=1 Tax=Janibacter sp. DB-40 TaxID=3028808 RepID=UPI002404ED1A|nr:APC family permease [Janibacter sp. DB-40]